MKHQLYIPFKQYHWLGGPATFMQNLQHYLDRQHHAYLPSLDNAKVVFFPNSFSLKKLQKIKEQGGYIIQRLDGIHYPSKHGEQYLELNKNVKDIYLHYADTVIFQSRYSVAQCFEMFGECKNYHIIINGVEKSIFYPAASLHTRTLENPIRFITTGRFRNIDMIEPVVQALDMLEDSLDFELTVIGPVVNAELTPFFQRPYITHIEALTLPEIAEELRKHDIFLYSHLNPPCPNSVIEAISCALPVVGFDSGAMAELCFFSKELLVPVSIEIFQKYEDFDAERLAEKITLAVQRYEHYRDVALAHSHLYSFEECGRKYLNVFESYVNRRRKFGPSMKHSFIQMLKRIRCIPVRLKSRIFKRVVLSSNSFLQRLLLKLNEQQFLAVMFTAIARKSSSLPPADSLKFLFEIDNRLYSLEGQEAVRYGNGLHTKHRHIKYHDFFISRIEPGSCVLDVGCGNGALAYDIAAQVSGVFVYGIDIVPGNVDVARKTYSADNITFVCGDALTDLPEQHVDVIVLSNVLEHIEKRVEFLNELQRVYQPQKFLIRVPVFERDWRVPLKQELGIDYRLDPTHYIEYRQDEFFQEIADAGLCIKHLQVNWGEIWSEVMKNTR